METAIYLMLALILYFAPTWLARRGRRLSIFIVNAAFGWTLLGWVIALVMAARSWETRGVR